VSPSLVLPRPGTLPAADPEVDAVPTAAVAVGDNGSELPRRRTRRRLPHPPGKRGHLWLAALVAGAVVAALPAATGGGTTDVAATAADYGLGTASDVGLDGSMGDASARQSITEPEARARLGELAASRAAREPKTVLPTQGRLTTCFCMRWGTMHWGIDLAAPLGTPILAATDGVVLRAGPASGYGNAVYIQDADGNVEIYGHMRYYNVRAGDIVHAGDQIAKVGSEGQSTGPHLHFQIDRGGMTGRPTDPQKWLADRGIVVG
jgi:murein DD-endopeptidase MepM/ murein hydrolase activator NlpD